MDTNFPEMPTPEQLVSMATPDLKDLPDPRIMELEFQMRLNKNIQDKLIEVTAAINDKNWVERNPVWFAILMAIASAIIGAIVSKVV